MDISSLIHGIPYYLTGSSLCVFVRPSVGGGGGDRTLLTFFLHFTLCYSQTNAVALFADLIALQMTTKTLPGAVNCFSAVERPIVFAWGSHYNVGLFCMCYWLGHRFCVCVDCADDGGGIKRQSFVPVNVMPIDGP